jgi:hypothetical protein
VVRNADKFQSRETSVNFVVFMLKILGSSPKQTIVLEGCPFFAAGRGARCSVGRFLERFMPELQVGLVSGGESLSIF